MSTPPTIVGPVPEQRIGRALPPIVPSGFREPVREALPAAIDRLIATARPRRVILFGSYAWGTATPASDVDLLVVLDEALPFADRYRLVGGALVPRAFPLDLIVLSQAELDHQMKAGSHFYREILARGQVLYHDGLRGFEPRRHRGHRGRGRWVGEDAADPRDLRSFSVFSVSPW